jgi:predicted lipoprotein with Yx(FWY)xxD motif
MRPLRATVLVLGLGLALAACSSAGGTTGTPAASAPASPAASTSSGGGRYGTPSSAPSAAPSQAPAASAAAGDVSVQLASSSLGEILVDGTGRTLYVFTPDSAGTSTCYDSCAQTWPPLTASAAPMVGTGLDAGAFGTTNRTDGSTQVTFHGMPLYQFAGDSAAGQTNGQGIGGKWFVVDKDGNLVK